MCDLLIVAKESMATGCYVKRRLKQFYFSSHHLFIYICTVSRAAKLRGRRKVAWTLLAATFLELQQKFDRKEFACESSFPNFDG